MASGATSVAAMESTIKRAMGGTTPARMHLFQSVEDAVDAGIPLEDARTSKAFVTRDSKGRWHAIFIADNIKPGRELAVFLHEVGSHLGIESIATRRELRRLSETIRKWAARNDGSIESNIARTAMERVKKAQQMGDATDRGTATSERIAYFIEEAVKAGITPQALVDTSTPLGRFFKTMMEAFLRGVAKLGLIGERARVDISAQDMVDLALGAAHMAMRDHVTQADPLTSAASYSRIDDDGPTPRPAPQPLGSMIHDELQGSLETARHKGLFKLATIEQLADRYGDHIPAIGKLSKLYDRMEALAKTWIDRASTIDKQWSRLSQKEIDALSYVMRFSTRAHFDPSDPQQTPTNEQQRKIARAWKHLEQLSNERIGKLGKQAREDAWTAQQIFNEVRDHYAEDFNEVERYLEAVSKAENPARVESIVRVMDSLKKQRHRPYFPLRRLGDYFVVGMSSEFAALREKDVAGTITAEERKKMRSMVDNPKHFIVESAKRQGAAIRRERELRQTMGAAEHNAVREHLKSNAAAIMPEMAQFEGMLKELNIPAGVQETLRSHYEDILAHSLPEADMLKRLIERKGVHGEDTDMRAVFASTSQARAFALSRLAHTRDIRDAMAELDMTSRQPGELGRSARALHSTMTERENLAFDNQAVHPLVGRLTKLSYLSLLGASPAFWFINMTQVPVVTMPWLSARVGHGAGSTLSALGKGAKDTGKMMSARFENGEFSIELDWKKAKRFLSDNEYKMLEELKNHGQFDYTLGYDLASVAAGRNPVMDKIIRTVDAPTNATEVLNRGATALAAYRMYRKRNPDASHETASTFAREAVSKTHANYSPANKAVFLQRFMGSKGGAQLLFQFWNYQQHMAALTLTTFKDALGPIDKTDPQAVQQKKVAQATFAGMTATLMMTAGAFGLPFASTVLSVASLALGLGADDDETVDLEQAITNKLHDWSPEIAPYLARGFLNNLTGGEFSQRMSMGNIMNPFAFGRFSARQSTEDTFKEAAFAASGAAVSNTLTMADGVGLMLDGDYDRALEKLIPLKGVRDFIKGRNLSEDGFLDRHGKLIMPADEFDSHEVLLRSLGITPTRMSDYYRANNATYTPKAAVEHYRSNVLGRFANAVIRRDQRDMQRYWSKIETFNLRNPHVAITLDTINRSVEQRWKELHQRNSRGVVVNKNTWPYMHQARSAM